MTTDKRDIADFDHALEVFGADQERWPDGKRDAFGRLMLNDPRARTLYGEAQALDRLLETARRMPSRAQTDAVAARILSFAVQGQQADRPEERKTSAEVIQLPARTGKVATAVSAGRFGQLWQVAAVLVASLLVGVLAGTSSNMNSVVQDMADAVGLEVSFETTSVAWQDAAGEFYEDTL